MKLHRDQDLLPHQLQLGSRVIEHAYWQDGRTARLQCVAPACVGTSHSSLVAAFSGSGSSHSPSGLPQVSPPDHCPSSQDWLHKIRSSVSCQMLQQANNKGVSDE